MGGRGRSRTSVLFRVSKPPGTAVLGALLPGRARPSVLKLSALLMFSSVLSSLERERGLSSGSVEYQLDSSRRSRWGDCGCL